MAARNTIEALIKPIGIAVNGPNPWDIKINNPGTYARIISEGALGFGESYMDKWWDCERLDMLFERVMRANIGEKVKASPKYYWYILFSKLFNFQSKRRASQVAITHYDLGNNLFSAMLDKRMMYSCAYWQRANALDEAQEAKLELICCKLQLKPGMTLLDIGCGWGGMAKYAAERYGVNVVGVTVSEQQRNYATKLCRGLPIDIRLQDYRSIRENFDRIVSIGMFEHVGVKNYDIFMKTAHKALKDDGLFLLHTIGNNMSMDALNEWTVKYIFPNSMLPSIAQIAKSSEEFFVMEDWHNFGAYYDHTLMAWHKNFTLHWENLKNYYDERFYRMWTYYLLSCAGAFRARSMQLWQIVFSKQGVIGGYISPSRNV